MFDKTMNEQDRHRIWLMDWACRDCIRAVYLFNSATGKGGEMWAFTQNCFGDIAAIEWCHIFNNYKDHTHFTQLFGRSDLPPTNGDFSLDAVRTRIWTAGGFTENTFSVFREEMRTFRDRWVAHRDATVKDIVFPNIDKAMSTCFEMRDVLREFVSDILTGCLNQKKMDLKYLLETYNNSFIRRQYEREASQLKRAQ
ncbi:hypothetical protein DRN97_10510 [Methanosarcinales archaeon]|nr:MAG: hypothetical protein DRN97_10510 [Methanosarcinales archaeon]